VAAAGVELLRWRLEGDPSLREGLEGAAASQLGASLTPGELRVELWPPGLRLAEPVLALAGGVRLELPETRIEADLGRLLRGVADVRGLAVEGPFRLAYRGGRLEGRVSLVLRPGAPSAAWQVDGEVEPDSGGRLAIDGELRDGGRFAGVVDVEHVESAPFSAFLSAEEERAGEPEVRVSGRFSGRLDRSDPSGRASLRLTSDAALLSLPPVRLDGPVVLVAELPAEGVSEVAPGRLAVDATRARVDYAGSLAKASGRGASLTGGIVREPGGRLRLDDVRLQVSRFAGEIEPSAQGESP